MHGLAPLFFPWPTPFFTVPPFFAQAGGLFYPPTHRTQKQPIDGTAIPPYSPPILFFQATPFFSSYRPPFASSSHPVHGPGLFFATAAPSEKTMTYTACTTPPLCTGHASHWIAGEDCKPEPPGFHCMQQACLPCLPLQQDHMHLIETLD